MSRRKQEKPQPRKNLIKGEAENVDILTCGACRKDFPLADIVRFIQHKVQLCNKENCLGLYEDSEDSLDPALPVLRKEEEGGGGGKEDARVTSSSLLRKNLTSKDASANTSDNGLEPRIYVCSTCKQSLSSAWSLILHVQNAHGLSICVDISDSNDATSDKPFDSSSALHHSFGLRAPLLERQIDPVPLFPRNSSQELRLDLIGKSSTLPNGPLGCSTPPPLLEPPAISNCEPMQDFYSQRLRVLAGATSPNATSTPRKSVQPSFKAILNNIKTSPRASTPPESSSSPPEKSNALNNSSASSTTSDQQQSPSAKNRLCEYCGKSFQFKSNLIVHRRSHTGEKPFKCHICNHACTQASKLKRHMKTHRGKNSPIDKRVEKTVDPAGDDPGCEEDVKGVKVEEEEDDPGPKTNGEKHTNGDCASDGHDEDDIEEEEIDVEEDLMDEDDEELNVDGLEDEEIPRENGEGKLVIDHSLDDDAMVAEDLTKKPLKNGMTNGNKKADAYEKMSKHSIVSEFMEKIGFSRIPQYNEAYKQALKESTYRNSIKQERCSSGTDGSASNDATSHHSFDVVPYHPLERPPRDGTRSAGQSPLNFASGMLDSLDHSLNLKRMRLDDQWKDKERDGHYMYAGVWYPRVEQVRSMKDIYNYEDGAVNHHKKSSSESAFSHGDNGRTLSPLPGPSSALCLANSLAKPKDHHRRNDTCEYCGKVFKNCSNLTVHRRSHTGEKPYKCELCSYACAQSSKLTRHMKTHGRLGKDVYRCRFCDMPFSVPSTLEKHMRKCVVSQSGGSPYVMSERDSDSKEMAT